MIKSENFYRSDERNWEYTLRVNFDNPEGSLTVKYQPEPSILSEFRNDLGIVKSSYLEEFAYMKCCIKMASEIMFKRIPEKAREKITG